MSSPTIGEHAIAMMLSLTRGLTPFAKMMTDGDWRRDFARSSGMLSVDGKTMLVVGLGGIGKQVALRAKALGMRVVATRNSSREGPDYVDYVGLSDELHALAAEADVIVNALPLTEATAGLFDKTFFAHAKAGSYFINVGRGGTVVTDELLAALEEGRLAGAGLDVTDPEPLPADHPLWQMPNVIITPHVAGFGGSRRWHAMLVRENIRRFIAGEPLLNVVDPERGY
jgi:phosphoglycerate dehydrogenase-like enzyme